MHRLTQNLTFKTFTLILAIALLVPTGVKFAHIFNHHHHEICNGEIQVHLHKADFDCDFHKFKLGSAFTLPEIDFIFISTKDNHSISDTSYSFLSEYQRLHFSLRGPPRISLV